MPDNELSVLFRQAAECQSRASFGGMCFCLTDTGYMEKLPKRLSNRGIASLTKIYKAHALKAESNDKWYWMGDFTLACRRRRVYALLLASEMARTGDLP